MKYFVVKSYFGNLNHEDGYLEDFQKEVERYLYMGFKPVGQMIINTDNNGNGCYYQTMTREIS